MTDSETQEIPSVNESALAIFPGSDPLSLQRLGAVRHEIAGATCVDFGILQPGCLAGGQRLAELCMGDLANIALSPSDPGKWGSSNLVAVQTDSPVVACLGSQYAGWPVQTDDFFAMGSGPMRMARGREAALEHLGLAERPPSVVGILECDQLPTESAIKMIAADCGVETQHVYLALAPSTSIAGSYQVVARSIETAMHKMHELKYDVGRIVSATGVAPLPPPAKPGKTIAGIGRTNDAILYGATVTMWVDDDESVGDLIERIPSQASPDHGRPFAEIFQGYEYDFYKVDPMLFSPARIIIHSLKSGTTASAGMLNPDILRQSFA